MYTVNRNYFKVIDTEEKAYWLGFLYADGCILESVKNGRVKAMNIELSLKYDDIKHLKKFLYCICSNAPIKKKKVKLNDKVYYACRVNICCTEMCRDLIKLGCTPRKSLTLKFPNEEQVPKHLLKHFIRGYFDGDGCISHGKHNIIYNNEYYTRCGFSGTKDILEGIHKYLDDFGLNRITHVHQSQAYEVMWGGKNNALKIYHALYDNATIYLDRKYEKFQLAMLHYQVIDSCKSDNIGEA